MFDYMGYILDSIASNGNIWWQIGAASIILLFALLVRGLFTRFIFNLIIKLTHKTKTDLDSAVMIAFQNPLKFQIVVIGLYFALIVLPLGPLVMSIVANLYRTSLVVFIAWGLYNLSDNMLHSEIAEKLRIDRIIADFTAKVVRFIIAALAVSIIAQEWDYDVNGFLAGMGLGGLAFALAAKDAISNVFGGLIIILDKPFAVGDWILTPSVEGTVEVMNFRSTKIRTFAHALVTVPNSVIANEAITNWSRMEKRRISFHLGVTYATKSSKLQVCIARIKVMLEKHPEVHPDTIFVRFNEFNDSSLDIFIYFFTKTTAWGEYLKVREDINFKLLDILEEEGVSVAFPSRSIYLEKTGDEI